MSFIVGVIVGFIIGAVVMYFVYRNNIKKMTEAKDLICNGVTEAADKIKKLEEIFKK